LFVVAIAGTLAWVVHSQLNAPTYITCWAVVIAISTAAALVRAKIEISSSPEAALEAS
jgi:hypothetical protein